MSPKKSTSKKPAAKRSASRKSTAKAVGTSPGEAVEPDARKMASKKAGKKSSKKAAKKPQPLTVKPAEMTEDVLEFIQAIDDYKRSEGRPFPTWSEIFDVVKMLGYEKSA